MASNFLVRLLTSLLSLLIAGVSVAQAFGRFGYEAKSATPGFVIDEKGFRINHPNADTFRFTVPQTRWEPVQTTYLSQVVNLSGGYESPLKLKQELLAPGFSLYFPQSMRFTLSTTTAPFLSWAEGTLEANTGYPTPETRWLVVSFKESQPPLLIGFPDKMAEVRLEGRSGEWSLFTTKPIESWVRIVAPCGVLPRRTNTVTELGALLAEIKANAEYFWQSAPNLVSTQVEDDGNSVQVQYKFDKPGAVIPVAPILANYVTPAVRISSDRKRIEAPTEEGPLELCTSDTLTIRFIARRIPTGRAVVLGELANPISTASYLDPQSVAELALTNLLASTPTEVRKIAEQTVEEYLAESALDEEPRTQQKLPYRPDGMDLDLVAAHALLSQTTESVRRPGAAANGLFASLGHRLDWYTWSFKDVFIDTNRRALALGAVTGALDSTPERRLLGCMMFAGLESAKGLAIWNKRRGWNFNSDLIQPYPILLAELFSTEDYRRGSGVGSLILSPIRFYGDAPVTLSKGEGEQLALNVQVKKDAAVMLTFASGFPIELVSPSEVWSINKGFGLLTLAGTPKQDSDLVLRFVPPKNANIPVVNGDLRYSEPKWKGP